MEKLDEERINKENEIEKIKRFIADHTSTINSLKDELKANYAELCEIYSKYEPWNSLKGKCIEIKFKSSQAVVRGFYKGEFEKTDSYLFVIKPILYKIKKDGTKSINRYAHYDIPMLENMEYVKEIQSTQITNN